MKVTATEVKLPKLQGTLGEISIPFVGVPIMSAPIDIDLKAPADFGDIDLAALTQEAQEAIDQVLNKLAKEVKAALDAAIRSPVWAWSSGSRDIFNTGELMQSGSVTVSGSGIQVSYSAPYANLVHNGGYIYPYGNKKLRPIYLPGRPWERSVLQGGGPVKPFDFADFFDKNL